MFIPGDPAFLLECKTVKRCLHALKLISENKTGGSKPSKAGNDI